jgi:hypothetical protein
MSHRPAKPAVQRCITVRSQGWAWCLSDLVTTPFSLSVGAGHLIVDSGAYPVGLSAMVKHPKPPQFVRFARKPDWRFGPSV